MSRALLPTELRRLCPSSLRPDGRAPFRIRTGDLLLTIEALWPSELRGLLGLFGESRCREKDLNLRRLRRQIYSLLPLAAWVSRPAQRLSRMGYPSASASRFVFGIPPPGAVGLSQENGSAISSRILILASMGGWVDRSFMTPPPPRRKLLLRGFSM